jgi:lysophospholipase L1-like esterase
MKKTITLFFIAMSFYASSCSKKQIIEPDKTVFDNKLNTTLSAPLATGALDDTNIKYYGRWDFSNTANYVSYWGGAYIKVNFSGTTVKVKVGNTNNFYAKIDNGPWISYLNASGTINLTPSALASGVHSPSVAEGKDYDYEFDFQGLVLDAGATTSAPNLGANLIEYIGDSITAGYLDAQANVSGYAWVCSEMLNSEHTQIAYPGIKLVTIADNGMEDQYLKLKSNNTQTSADWDFTKYTPNVIVINLGTNDNNYTEETDNTFQTRYISFLQTIRSKFPNTEIFVMRTFIGGREAPTSAAVNARILAGDTKVHYINTSGWLTQGTSDYLPDNVHPSVSGHIKAANLLKPILQPYVGGSPLIANGTYKIINRNSGLALDAYGQATANGTLIQQYTYGGTSNQKWAVTSLGNGRYKIIGVQSGRSLDITGQLTADGTAVELYDYNGGNNQQWEVIPTSGGYYAINSVQSGKPIEVSGQSTAAGAAVDLYSSNGGNHQQWIFAAP